MKLGLRYMVSYIFRPGVGDYRSFDPECVVELVGEVLVVDSTNLAA